MFKIGQCKKFLPSSLLIKQLQNDYLFLLLNKGSETGASYSHNEWQKSGL